jgi:LmbE family N-acetylglucosaminyl deacetylase
MENKWLLTWFLAPVFSPAAMAIEAYSLNWFRLEDADKQPVPPTSDAGWSMGRPSLGSTLLIFVTVVALTFVAIEAAADQAAPTTLVAVFAHADDEGAAAPILARYAREGVRVQLIIATDGAQGGTHTSVPRGPELARARSDEARCAADALGIREPILLGFPDAQLGNYIDEPARLFRLTARLQQELQRLAPDALITWGPDGATGHPDHRLVSSVVTQLVRAGAPGAPERMYYVSIPVEGMRAMNPSRPEPAFLVPLAKYFSVRIAFTPADMESARRAMSCHQTQYSEAVVERIAEMQRRMFSGALSLVPFRTTDSGTDLFRNR